MGSLNLSFERWDGTISSWKECGTERCEMRDGGRRCEVEVISSKEVKDVRD